MKCSLDRIHFSKNVFRFDRVASVDYQLGQYQIPSGSIVMVPVYPIHHDATLWPDPEKFLPQRFVASNFRSISQSLDDSSDFHQLKKRKDIQWLIFLLVMDLG